jgi:hypothetical protein
VVGGRGCCGREERGGREVEVRARIWARMGRHEDARRRSFPGSGSAARGPVGLALVDVVEVAGFCRLLGKMRAVVVGAGAARLAGVVVFRWVALEVCLRPPSSPLSRMVLWLVACFSWCSCVVSLVRDQCEGWEKSLQMQDDGDACGRRYLLGGVVEALLVLPPSELRGKP